MAVRMLLEKKKAKEAVGVEKVEKESAQPLGTPARSHSPALPGVVIRDTPQSKSGSRQSVQNVSGDSSPLRSDKGKRKTHEGRHKKHKSSKRAKFVPGASSELTVDGSFFGVANTGLPADRALLKSPEVMPGYLRRMTPPNDKTLMEEESTGNLMRQAICDQLAGILRMSVVFDRISESAMEEAMLRSEKNATEAKVNRLTDDLQLAAQAHQGLQARHVLVTQERDDAERQKVQLEKRVEELERRLKKEEQQRGKAIRRAEQKAVEGYKASEEFENLKYELAAEFMEDGHQATLLYLQRHYPEYDSSGVGMEFTQQVGLAAEQPAAREAEGPAREAGTEGVGNEEVEAEAEEDTNVDVVGVDGASGEE